MCHVLPTPRASARVPKVTGAQVSKACRFFCQGTSFLPVFTFKCFKEHGSNSFIFKHWNSHLQLREQEHSLPTTPATSVELVGSVQYLVPARFQVTPLGGVSAIRDSLFAISDSKDQLKQ